MKRLTEAIMRIMQGLFAAVARFPLTVIFLGCAAVLICYMISLHKEPALLIQKLMFTCLLGSFLSVTAQFNIERFVRLSERRYLVYFLSALLVGGYYLILAPARSISFEVQIRTFVAIFAMTCAFIWVPSYKGRFDFNRLALIHFKSFFTAVLYSGVLAAGCAAIIAAVDTLLFNVNSDAYGYMMTIVWVLFAPIYYLSLLPHFNSDDECEHEYAEHAGQYPRVLEILVSYIAIPLLTAYTLVLTAYFIKILVTFKWPSGQLGVMVLAYSAAGLLIFILASPLDNRVASLYRLIFPKVLIPVVIMQLISVAIRLNAYGVTESRYYVTLFGIFSITCGLLLSFKPVSKNGLIALLAAGFAIFSVVPPVDAFTVSRVSQISRLENMLIKEGILVNGKLVPKSDPSLTVKTEATNILAYLENHNYTQSIKWLPDDFESINDMKNVLGFEPSYQDFTSKSFYANIDMQKPFDISGYDICLNSFSESGMGKTNQSPIDFQINGVNYKLIYENKSPNNVYVSIKNGDNQELVGTNMADLVKSLSGIGTMTKETIPPEKMTFNIENNGYKLRIVFQNVNINYNSGSDKEFQYNYSAFILFGANNNQNM